MNFSVKLSFVLFALLLATSCSHRKLMRDCKGKGQNIYDCEELD